MRYRRWASFGLLLVLCALSLTPYPTTIATAQGGGTLTYGSNVTGIITPESPLILYSFNGTQGDRVRVDALGLSNGLEPVIDLLAPDRQIVATSQPDSLASTVQDARIALYLPVTGVYSMMIGGANNTVGQYALQLAGHSPVSTTPLVFGEKRTVSVPQNAAPQMFTFTAESCLTTLVVSDISPAEPHSFPFIVTVRDSQARTVAVLRGGETLEDRVTVEPLSGNYEVDVWVDDPAQQGILSLLVTCADQTPACLPNDYGMTDAAGTASECPECPPCSALDEDPALCASFAVTVDAVDEGRVTFSWPVIEGAEAVIWSIQDETGGMVAARMVMTAMGTSETVDLTTVGTGPGIYTIIAYAWAEDVGYLCEATSAVEIEGLGPVDWGPAAACSVQFVAPLDDMANGLQTFFWSDVEGATSYRLRMYSESGALVAEGAISAPATSMTLDASTSSIGPGTHFDVSIEALRASGDVWCIRWVTLTRLPGEAGS